MLSGVRPDLQNTGQALQVLWAQAGQGLTSIQLHQEGQTLDGLLVNLQVSARELWQDTQRPPHLYQKKNGSTTPATQVNESPSNWSFKTFPKSEDIMEHNLI